MKDPLKHHELTDKIIGVFYEVYNELGSGFLESVYENALLFALTAKGLEVGQQIPIPVWFRGKKVGDFKADLVVENSIIVELKSVRSIDDVHIAQLLNYLRATDIEVGLLLNFGQRPEFKRKAFDNQRKKQEPNNRSLAADLLSGN